MLQQGIPPDLPPPCPTGQTAGNGSTYLRCQYLLVHKRYRQCKMTRRVTEPYCATHMDQFISAEKEPSSDDKKRKANDMIGGKKHNNDSRIECPVDPRHRIWKSDLNTHVKKCPALVKAAHYKSQPWYKENVCLVDSQSLPDDNQAEISGEEFRDIANRLKQWNKQDLPVIEKSVMSHSGLNSRLSQLENKKHALQQSSIAGHLERNGLLEPDLTYVELGCGRAELSRYLNQCILLQSPTQSSTRYLLIDRDGARMKFDPKIVSDAEDAGLAVPKVVRLRVDIKDLELGPALSQVQACVTSPSVCCISKHLCGAATDLSIQCIANYVKQQRPNHNVKGILIALCCRHRCSWEAYPLRGRQLLASTCNITDKRQFYILSKMTSWAVCGRRSHQSGDDVGGHISGYTVCERELLGRYARQLIDYGRFVALEELGFNVQLVQYVESSVSLENTLLIALPKM